jgi:hypothetical protein
LLYSITYGRATYQINVEFLDRKRLSITVHPDLSITAKAPINTDRTVLENRLQKRAAWIARQFAYFEQYHPQQPERQYVSGETHCYLGRQYRLRIRAGNKSKVRLIGRFFEVETLMPDDRKHIRKLIRKWYLAHAKQIINKRLKEWLPVFERWQIMEPEIQFRRMRKRWGSLTSKGTILFNTELVKAPLQCVDYVIVHELCHLVYPKHDSRYYRLLERIMPDWKRRKERLERVNID